MVLVTGATGLIGSYLLVELSKRGEKIRALKRRDSSFDSVKELFAFFSLDNKFNDIEWVECDLSEMVNYSALLHNVETIYHTAASVGFDDRHKRQIHEINVKGTENLVNEATDQRVSNFVYISSIAVLDELPGETIITENSKWDENRSHSEYAISKKKGEMTVWRGSQEGLRVLVVYPSVVIGSLDGKRASERIFKLASGRRAVASEGLTGYVDVRDVAFSMAELVDKGRWNEAYILSSEDKTFLQVFNFLRRKWDLENARILTKKKIKFVHRISQFSRLFGGPYMSKASYHALTGDVHYSNKKIKDTIGIEFIAVEDALNFHADRFTKKSNLTKLSND